MARRRVRRKKRAAPAAPEPEVVKTVEAVEPEAVEKPSAARRRRPRRVVEAPVEPETQVVDAADTQPTGRAKQRRVRRVRKADVEVPAAPEVIETDDEGESVSGDDAVKFLLSVLDAGEAIVLRKVDGDFVLSKFDMVTPAVSKSGAPVQVMTKREMCRQATTEDYQEFREWWKTLTFEEKVAEAEVDGVEWERSDVPLTDNLRLTIAYRKAHGIEKWKPEFQTTAARRALLHGG